MVIYGLWSLWPRPTEPHFVRHLSTIIKCTCFKTVLPPHIAQHRISQEAKGADQVHHYSFHYQGTWGCAVLPTPALLYHLITSGPPVSLRSFECQYQQISNTTTCTYRVTVHGWQIHASGSTRHTPTTITSGNTGITECLTAGITDKNWFLHWGRNACLSVVGAVLSQQQSPRHE